MMEREKKNQEEIKKNKSVTDIRTKEEDSANVQIYIQC